MPAHRMRELRHVVCIVCDPARGLKSFGVRVIPRGHRQILRLIGHCRPLWKEASLARLMGLGAALGVMPPRASLHLSALEPCSTAVVGRVPRLAPAASPRSARARARFPSRAGAARRCCSAPHDRSRRQVLLRGGSSPQLLPRLLGRFGPCSASARSAHRARSAARLSRTGRVGAPVVPSASRRPELAIRDEDRR